MNNDKVTIEVINGCEGKCIAINNYRVAGPKPWGGGTVEKSWTVEKREILRAIHVKIDDE